MDSNKNLAQKVANYQPSPEELAHIKHVPILPAVGVTAAGKDTVLMRLIQKYPDDYRFIVSHTTRPRRVNDGVIEEDGVKYYFVDIPTAEKMIDEKAFVETNYFASNVYGPSIREIERGGQDGKILVSDIDVNGAGNFMRLDLNAKPVFLLPPSFEVWQQRLQGRYGGTFDPADLRKRLETAKTELQNALDNDYFYLIINDDLDATVERVNDIAHGKPTEARPAAAIQLIQQLLAAIGEAIAKRP
jgi:guanylate kinase